MKQTGQVLTAPPKNTQTDYGEGFQVIRVITAIDVPVSGTPYQSMIPGFASGLPKHPSGGLDYTVNKQVSCLKAKTMQYRLFSNVSGGTCSIQFISEAPMGPGVHPNYDERLTLSKPTTFLAAAFTFSGSSTVGVNPITGAADASNTWYEASSWTSAFVDDNRVTEYPSGSGANYQKFFGVDCLGDSVHAPLCYVAPSSSGTIIVACRRVD